MCSMLHLCSLSICWPALGGHTTPTQMVNGYAHQHTHIHTKDKHILWHTMPEMEMQYQHYFLLPEIICMHFMFFRSPMFSHPTCRTPLSVYFSPGSSRITLTTRISALPIPTLPFSRPCHPSGHCHGPGGQAWICLPHLKMSSPSVLSAFLPTPFRRFTRYNTV